MAPHMAERLRAAGIHLLISCGVASVSAALVFMVLYPAPLARACGVTDIFLLLLVVDISLGPLITLFVFNRAKPELKRDLAIVGIIQLAALLYGLHTMYIARPVYVVFGVDRFDLVFANDMDDKRLATATLPAFKQVPALRPQTIAAVLPSDPAERSALTLQSVSGGGDLHQSPKFYRPIAAAKDSIIAHAQALEGLKQFNPANPALVDELAATYKARKVEVGFLPLKGKAEDQTVLVDRSNGAVLEIVRLRPWL